MFVFFVMVSMIILTEVALLVHEVRMGNALTAYEQRIAASIDGAAG